MRTITLKETTIQTTWSDGLVDDSDVQNRVYFDEGTDNEFYVVINDDERDDEELMLLAVHSKVQDLNNDLVTVEEWDQVSDLEWVSVLEEVEREYTKPDYAE
jgi:hypothetical protein